uniref:Protein kinase domain-containing protein n=1 Tax=Physcomitrium patens TaxID=3218 RepID=A0A2K1J6V9_PHYPA|nr:hypothetical protein PHYPA_020368 [Physcomitrium patens]
MDLATLAEIASTAVALVMAPGQLIDLCNNIPSRVKTIASGYDNEVSTILVLKSTITTMSSDFCHRDRPTHYENEALSGLYVVIRKKLQTLQLKLNKDTRMKRLVVIDKRRRSIGELKEYYQILVNLRSVHYMKDDMSNRESTLYNGLRNVSNAQNNVRYKTKSDLANDGVYEDNKNFTVPNDSAIIIHNNIQCMVEYIEPGSSSKEKKDRFLRHVAVVIALRDMSCNYIVKPWKIIEPKKGFYLLSKTALSHRLRDIIGSDVVKKSIPITIDITRVINEIHICGIAHKNINSSSILADANGNVGLSRFIGSRIMSVERSDNSYEQGSAITKRMTLLYQPPERRGQHPSSYSLSCDIYSLGVLLLEIDHGKCLLDDNTTNSGDEVFEAIQLSGDGLLGVARKCMQRGATERPSTFDIIGILEDMQYQH